MNTAQPPRDEAAGFASTEERGDGVTEPGGHNFEVVSTEDIYVGRILALRRDDVAMPGGGSAKREVVEHLPAVSIAALDDDGNVMLIHQYRHAIGYRIWELPAGLVDHAG